MREAQTLRESKLIELYGKLSPYKPKGYGDFQRLKLFTEELYPTKEIKKLTDPVVQYRMNWNYDINGERIHTIGLPQGAGTSPFLSAVYFESVLDELQKEYPSVKALVYADDCIFYSDNDKEFERFLNACNISIGTKWKSIVDYSAAQIENKGAGFSGARTSNIILKDPTREHSLQRQWPLQTSRLANHMSTEMIQQGSNPFEVNGLRLSYKKCQISKCEGIWTMPFIKFLGIKYSSKGAIISSTRGGRKLAWSFDQLLHESRAIDQTTPRATRYHQYSQGILNLLQQTKRNVINLHWMVQKGANYMRKAKNLRYFLSRKVKIKENTAGLGGLVELVNLVKKSSPKPELPYYENKFGEVYSGVLQSRLYLGSKIVPRFSTPSGAQDFKLRMKPGSVVQYLQSKGEALNNSNYSSYSLHELANYSTKSLKKSRSLKQK